MTCRKFILKEKNSVLVKLLLILAGRIITPGQLIMPDLTLAINMNFPLKLLKAKTEKHTKTQPRNKTSQLWDGFTCLTLGYGHLSCFLFCFVFLIFTYLAAPGLSLGTQDLCPGAQASL